MHGGDDDDPALAARLQVRPRVAREEERARQEHGEERVPAILVEVRRTARRAGSRRSRRPRRARRSARRRRRRRRLLAGFRPGAGDRTPGPSTGSGRAARGHCGAAHDAAAGDGAASGAGRWRRCRAIRRREAADHRGAPVQRQPERQADPGRVLGLRVPVLRASTSPRSTRRSIAITSRPTRSTTSSRTTRSRSCTRPSFKAHVAAACAGDQHRYWEMHDKLFADQRNLTLERFVGTRRRCSSSIPPRSARAWRARKHDAMIREDVGEAQRGGVPGHAGVRPRLHRSERPKPSRRSRVIVGAQPYEAFKEAIDAMLTHATTHTR